MVKIWEELKEKIKEHCRAAFFAALVLVLSLAAVIAANAKGTGNNAGENAEPNQSGENSSEASTDHGSGGAGSDPSEEGQAGENLSAAETGGRNGTDGEKDSYLEEASLTLEPSRIASATLGATGDILIHMAVLQAFATGDGYDFSPAFAYVAPYYQSMDLMAANLEVPLVNPADGWNYSANPFASPDTVAAALKNAGVDICLTANNHTYDAGHYGLIRTQQVLDGLGLGHIGTRKSVEESFLMVREVNGIRIGMACWTYETGADEWCEKTLNGIGIPEEDARLINSFCFERMEDYYEDAEETLRQMAALGCEASVFFMHWGEEYEDSSNAFQQEIARRLAELGVDVIIGGHPHVIQRYEVLENADGHRTAVLYSMGNALSNQRKEYMSADGHRGYTEDGTIFIVRFDKYDNGEVRIGDVFAIPTWVEQTGGIFRIVPLDPGKSPEEWPAADKGQAMESYQRTIGRIWG